MTEPPNNMTAAARAADIARRIAAAARSAGRDPSLVRLVAVSKTFAAPDILPVIEAGHRIFGENRVQEAQGKWPALKERFPDVSLHLVGPLQSNKARDAVALFDVIHSIDRPKIAAALADEMARAGKRLELFIQVNTGAEPQKAGVLAPGAPGLARYCRSDLGLELAGLMCIPPADEDPARHFTALAALAKELDVPGLSMGMSGDFEAAIRCGATHVRIGGAIFGER